MSPAVSAAAHPPFEQGPIRPPSEASSLLVRVSRNCPWNHCAFCPVYKGEKFSLRPVEEVLGDLEAMHAVYGERPRSVFLQDANALLTPPEDLVRVLERIRELFPTVERITTYARSHTLVKRSLEELKRLRAAGLNRIHVGLESGNDAVLKLMVKGVTRARQIEGGQRAKAADFELSEYVMPGLGGEALSEAHAEDTASALVAIGPDFIRLRTTTVLPGSRLEQMVDDGAFVPMSEIGAVTEIRSFLGGLRDISPCRLTSDHMMNLMGELEGALPRELDRMIGICDELLELPEQEQRAFVMARRLNLIGSFEQFQRQRQAIMGTLEQALKVLESQGRDPEELFAMLRKRIL